ncbi:MAG: hypothetical protein B9J98_05730 [Candidatus Terraquivivens tikiterensis]|uniref:DOD-type homing endonuclease domain-containing protein n=1 Tax=Candidatus Terraquivivens tikiterensis TaxID=1980982 RepID=A0A2R7Y1Z3_9ARCH|nr:MAG: hypothetical protein B9J98_05730 [Candidatus Terraquivivens tikiterensis]
MGRRCRPASLRKELYHRVLELRGMGLSYREIQRRIFKEFGENLSKSIISGWIRRVHTPYGDGLGYDVWDLRRHRLRPCPELAYAIGAALGDGYTKYEGKYHYAVALAVKDYDFAEEFGRCAAIALGREKPYKPYWDRSKRRWVARAYSRELYELLRKPVDFERIRPYVEHCEKCVATFLRGLADAEGDVDKNENNFGRISIANTDRQLMEYALALLKALGIFARLYKRRKRETENIEGRVVKRERQFIYLLRIYRNSDILRFREVIGFAIKRKQEVLDELHRRTIARRACRPPKPSPPSTLLFPTFHTLTLRK